MDLAVLKGGITLQGGPTSFKRVYYLALKTSLKIVGNQMISDPVSAV